MNEKLQELTDKLYKEGLAKGQQEAEKVLADARAQAEKIVADAKAQAEKIMAKAGKDAADLAEKTASDVKMASQQALQATKKDIENLLVAGVAGKQVKETLAGAEVMKQVVLAVAKGFSASESAELEVVLPESLKAELQPWAEAELAKALNAGVKASFSKKIAGGMTIGPADGSWYVSLTDETFNSLIEEYLRPVTKKFLFGE